MLWETQSTFTLIYRNFSLKLRSSLPREERPTGLPMQSRLLTLGWTRDSDQDASQETWNGEFQFPLRDSSRSAFMSGLMPQLGIYLSLPTILRSGETGGKTLRRYNLFSSWERIMFHFILFFSQGRKLLPIKTGLYWAKSAPQTILIMKALNSARETEQGFLARMLKSAQKSPFLLGDTTYFLLDQRVRILNLNGMIFRPKLIMS